MVYIGAGGYAGCAYCTHLGEHSNILQKMVYPGNRCFLKKDDDLRNDTSNYPSKSIDSSSPPKLKTTEYVNDANQKYVAAHTSTERKELAQQTGCKGPCVLEKLPFHDRLLNTPVDPMHLIKNIVSHCVNLVAGNADSAKVREEEKLRKRFPMSWMIGSQGKLRPAPFCLSKEDIQLANDRANRILVPYGFDWRPRDIFSKSTGMKSHEWKQLSCHGILKFCLRGMLGKRQRSTLFKLFDAIKFICAEVVLVNSLDGLEDQVHKVLALMERDFPVSMQVMVFHLFHHLPMFIKRFGPVYSFWMYSYERFNSWLTRRILNRRYPEATVIETYRLSEWAHFMELSGQIVEGTLRSIDNSSSLPECNLTTHPVPLTEEVIECLRLYYCNDLPEYKELTEQYEEERNRARVAHQLNRFPAMCEWVPKYSQSLSSQQHEMCLGPVSNGMQLKRFVYKDKHGRTVVLRSAEYEPEHSYCRSSFVSSLADSHDCVGRIVSLFQHTFLSTTTTFAYMSWFDGPYLDTDSNLNFVLASEQTQSVTPVSSLSKPLVIAYDDEESNKLWILSL